MPTKTTARTSVRTPRTRPPKAIALPESGAIDARKADELDRAVVAFLRALTAMRKSDERGWLDVVDDDAFQARVDAAVKAKGEAWSHMIGCLFDLFGNPKTTVEDHPPMAVIVGKHLVTYAYDWDVDRVALAVVPLNRVKYLPIDAEEG